MVASPRGSLISGCFVYMGASSYNEYGYRYNIFDVFSILALPMCVEFHRIKYFLEVARWSSFSRAAEVCNISQPSLSQQIKKLENEVGGQLILRSRDGVCLSELGQSFLPYARDMMHAVESAWDFVDESHQKVTGRVRIGAIPTIAPYLLPTILKHLRSDYPDVQYEVVEETTNLLIDKLRQGEIDFAILSPPTKVDPDVEHVDLCEDELMLTLPLDHSLNKEKVLDIGSLKDEKLLLLKETHCLSQQSKSFCSSFDPVTEINLKSSQLDTLLGLVELGFGFTLTPKLALPYLRGRNVRFHSASPESFFRTVRMIWMSRHTLSTVQIAILESIRAIDYS